MKSFVVVFVLIVALSIDGSEAGHRKQKSKSSRNEEGQDSGSGLQGPQGLDGPDGPQAAGDWPNPGSVSNFEIPSFFTNSGGLGDSDNAENESSSGKHHGKIHHKGRRN